MYKLLVVRNFIILVVGYYRRIKHYVSTFLLKRQLVSFGNNIGAANIPQIARTAKVTVGHNCGFNGIKITGLGGGENWLILPFWN